MTTENTPLPDRRAFVLLLVAFVVLTLGLFAPAFTGLVPFPADIALRFPPWSSVAPGCCDAIKHAEMGDLVTQFYPWHMRLNAMLGQWDLPIWNHFILMGTPFLAESTPGVFFPLNWLFAVTSAPAAWTALLIVRYILIAFSTMLFARHLRLSLAGSAVAALVFTFCGWTVAFNGRPHLDSAMWLPLMLLCVDRVADRQTAARTIALAGAFAMSVLGGHPEVAAQVILLAVLYAVYRGLFVRGRRGAFALSLLAASLLAVAMAAIQVLPTLEWLGRIERDLSIRWGAHPLSQLAGLISRDLQRHPNADGVFIPEAASYVGVVTLLLAWLSILWSRRRDVVAMVGIGVVSVSAAFALPPLDWLVQRTPVLNGLPNFRFVVGLDFALAMLAGMGAGAVIQRIGAARGLPAGAPRWAAVAFVLVVAADLGTYMRPYLPWFPASAIFQRNPTFDYLIANAGGVRRVAAVDITYGNNFEVPYGLSTATGYDFPTTRASLFLGRFAIAPGTVSFDSAKLVALSRGALDLTGTRYFVATDWNAGAGRLEGNPDRFRFVFKDGMVRVFENPDALPLVTVLPSAAVRVIENDEAQLTRVFDASFDPHREVVLGERVSEFFGDRGVATVDEVSEIRTGGSFLELTAQASGAALVYINETFYEGARVTVDGRRSRLLRANYAFTAVAVTAGRHTIRVSYVTPALTAGIGMSGLAWTSVVIWIVVSRARERSWAKGSARVRA